MRMYYMLETMISLLAIVKIVWGKKVGYWLISLTMIYKQYIPLYGAQMKYQKGENSNMYEVKMEVIDQYIFVKNSIHTYQVKENYQWKSQQQTYGLNSYTLLLSIEELQMYIKTNAGSSCLSYGDTGGLIHFPFPM